MAFNWLEGILKSFLMCFGVETLKDNSSPMGSPMKSLSCPCTIFTPEDNSSSSFHKSSQDASDSPFRNTAQTLNATSMGRDGPHGQGPSGSMYVSIFELLVPPPKIDPVE